MKEDSSDKVKSENLAQVQHLTGADQEMTPLDGLLQGLLDLALESDTGFAALFGPLARELLIELDPQDPAEKMLVTQMVATFSRSLFLSRHANQQKNTKWFTLYSAECDRAMNMYRKQMQLLSDYRRPRRARQTTFNAIRTANIAGQQVVVSGPVEAPPIAGGDAKEVHDRPAALAD